MRKERGARRALGAARERKSPTGCGGRGGALKREARQRGHRARDGARFLLRGHQTFTASVQAIHDVMKALREGAAPEEIAGEASKELMQVVTRGADYKRMGEEWL